MAYAYPIALAAISLFVLCLERLNPRHAEQPLIRRALGHDLLFLVLNGHFLGVALYEGSRRYLLPAIDGWLASQELTNSFYRNAAHDLPLLWQIPLALLVIDFLQWMVHNALHRVPALWPLHQLHHSVEDGEMDWVVSFRFHFGEVLVYKAVLFVPLAWFGFRSDVILVHAIFGTLIGHLNHANLSWTWGPLRYLLNSPAMHAWHHDYNADPRQVRNFGIIFSLWDWLFGTAYMPGHAPKRLGYAGAETYPRDVLGATGWPLARWIPASRRLLIARSLGVLIVIAGAWLVWGSV